MKAKAQRNLFHAAAARSWLSGGKSLFPFLPPVREQDAGNPARQSEGGQQSRNFHLPHMTASEEPPDRGRKAGRTEVLDLDGEWREQNGSDDSFHGILISGDTIEIYWVSEGGNATSLYWAGSYVPPPDGKEPYTWVSENDVTRTSAAQLASGESTKTFTYQNGILSYSASVLGVTTTIETKKHPWQPVADEEGNLVTPPADDG